MEQSKPKPLDDEIDLFELFQTLWQGKWLISVFVIFAVLLGGCFVVMKEAVYESQIRFSVDTLPPFYEAEKASADFEKMFYNESVFDSWKEINATTAIAFENFSNTEVVEGFVVSKDEDDQLAVLSKNKDSASVQIKTDDLSQLNDFYNYAHYINDTLKAEYVKRAQNELDIIETRFDDFSNSNDSIIQSVLAIDRYIDSASKGADVLAIQRPTMPKKVSPKTVLVLALSIVLGGMLGVFWVLIRSVIRKHNAK